MKGDLENDGRGVPAEHDLVSLSFVLELLRRETFSAAEHDDEYTRGWIAALQHIEQKLGERRTVAGMRELRDAVPTLTEATSCAFDGEGG